MIQFLRENSKIWHEKAEANNTAKFIIDHSITIDQYKLLIIKYYEIYAGIELFLRKNKSIAAVWLLEYMGTEKTDLLLKDLEALKITPPEININLAITDTKINHLIGAIYTIEGSMLGGQLIARNITECPNLKEVSDFYFFGKQKPANLMKKWKSFCNTLKETPFSETEKKEALEASVQVFELFSR